MAQEVIDISREIANDSVVWADDPPLNHSFLSTIGPGCPCQVTKLDGWSTHFLTHVDAPAHFIANAPTLDQMPLSRFMCRAVVHQIPDNAKVIEKNHIAMLGDVSGKGVLFKTANSNIATNSPFKDDFVYISPDAAKALVVKNVSLVGVDYLSVDPAGSTDYPTHYMLLGAGIIILEGTQLKEVVPAEYDLFTLPLKIRAADGSPVRAVLTKATSSA